MGTMRDDPLFTTPETIEKGGVMKWVCRAPKDVLYSIYKSGNGYCTPQTVDTRYLGTAHDACGWVKI